MERHNSCINTLAVIEYFQDHAPHLTAELCRQSGPEIDRLSDVKSFLMDPNNWVSGHVLVNMYATAKRLLGEDVIFKIGFDSVIKRRLGYIEKILLLALGGPRRAIKKVQGINDKFNRNKTIKTIEIDDRGAILQLHWFDGVPLSKDFCSVNKGTYTAIPVVWGLPPAHLEETKCFFEGDEFCEYRITWEKKSSIKNYLRKAITPWKVIESSVRELEKDKELIRKKYEEVHSLNKELKNRIDQLLSLQEVGSAILSTLEADCLFDLILKLLIKVARLDRAAIFVVDEEKQVLSLVHAVGVEPSDFLEVKGYTVPLSKTDNIIARAAARREPVFIKDVEQSPLSKDNQLIKKFKPKALILVPLAAQGRLLGVLVGDQIQDGWNASFPDPEFLTSFANQIAMSLNNSNLYKRLAESERRHRQLIENAHDGIWILDEENKISLANRRMSEILASGLSLGENIFNSVDGENGVILKTLLGQNKAGLVAQGMMELRGKADRQISVIVSSVPMMEGGEYKGSFAIVTDISEMKALERQLFQAQKMECIGTMAGGIAHDFNNILTSVLGYTSLLKRQVSDRSGLRYIDIIERSSLRAADLVRQILTFSRGGQIEKPVAVNVNEIVSETVQLLSNVMDKRIEIQFYPDSRPVAILGDATQLQQAILNICLNARDSMSNGGTIQIKTEKCDISAHCEQLSSLLTDGTQVKITISDTGSGIDHKNMDKIFDPFFTTKPLGKGTGLGLAIVHGIVKGMKGTINVDSHAGKGSTFELLFPAIDNEIIQQQVSDLEEMKGKGTILLVDDEEYLRELGEKVLTLNGYKVLLARDGLEALDIFGSAKETISLVILDLVMPNLSGEDTYKRLKEINPAVPVIICTGYSVDPEAMRRLKGEASGFIQKPFAFDQLVRAVRKGLEPGVDLALHS